MQTKATATSVIFDLSPLSIFLRDTSVEYEQWNPTPPWIYLYGPEDNIVLFWV